MTPDEIDELLADRNRLSVESTRLKLQLSMYQSTSAGVNKLANELAARVAKLEEGLRPFAAMWEGDQHGGLRVPWDAIKRAAELLAKNTPHPDPAPLQGSTMTEIQKAKRDLEAARKRLAKLEDEHHDKVVGPKMIAMLNQYWVYRNNHYSSSANPSDYWDVYAVVRSVAGCTVTLTVAHVDSFGCARIETQTALCFGGERPTGWELSTDKRFHEEVQRVKQLLGIE